MECSFIKNGKERKERNVLLKRTDAQPCILACLSAAQMALIHEIKKCQKISLHCPFNFSAHAPYCTYPYIAQNIWVYSTDFFAEIFVCSVFTTDIWQILLSFFLHEYRLFFLWYEMGSISDKKNMQRIRPHHTRILSAGCCRSCQKNPWSWN